MHTAVTRSSACALGRVAVAGFASVGWLGFRCFLALALMHRAQVALFYVAQCLTLRSSGPAFCGPLTLPVRAHTKMPRWLKRLLVGSAKIIVALVVVFGLLLGYGSYAEQSATRKASAMCSSIHIGDSTEDLRPRAIADGASEFQSRWFKADGVDMLYITYVGLPPFSRHMCVVRAQGGRVLSAKESYLD